MRLFFLLLCLYAGVYTIMFLYYQHLTFLNVSPYVNDAGSSQCTALLTAVPPCCAFSKIGYLTGDVSALCHLLCTVTSFCSALVFIVEKKKSSPPPLSPPSLLHSGHFSYFSTIFLYLPSFLFVFAPVAITVSSSLPSPLGAAVQCMRP